jgi:hypothetical protein
MNLDLFPVLIPHTRPLPGGLNHRSPLRLSKNSTFLSYLAFLNVADIDAGSPNHMRYATWGGGHATQWQDLSLLPG